MKRIECVAGFHYNFERNELTKQVAALLEIQGTKYITYCICKPDGTAEVYIAEVLTGMRLKDFIEYNKTCDEDDRIHPPSTEIVQIKEDHFISDLKSNVALNN